MVRWPERQFLIDQSVLATGQPLPPNLRAMSQAHFEDAAALYADSVLTRPPNDRSEQLTLLRGRIEPELLWLFSRSWQSTRGPFVGMAQAGLASMLSAIAAPYARLLADLSKHALARAPLPTRLSDVTDAAALADIAAYRVERLT